jgi:hypothetical protein
VVGEIDVRKEPRKSLTHTKKFQRELEEGYIVMAQINLKLAKESFELQREVIMRKEEDGESGWNDI